MEPEQVQTDRYRVIGGTMPAVVIRVNEGETWFTESGGMAWMSWNMEMQTSTGGGMMKAIGRKFAGESLFITEYTCTQGVGEIAFASSFPGRILPVRLAEGQSMICQKKSFLCAEKSVALQAKFAKRLGAGLFGGEGFILQQLTGPGLAFVEIDGDVEEIDLAEGYWMRVDPGHIAMMDPSVEYTIDRVKGAMNVFFSGEGLFLATVKGPGRLWLQTMPLANVVQAMMPYLPTSSS